MLIIHIGLHKAGSSTIQTFLRENAEALAARGVAYPTAGLGRRNGHHHLAQALRTGETLPEMAEIARAAEAGLVILSSEAFSLCRPQQVRAALGPARILCYRRDLVSDPVSRYLQMAKRGQLAQDFDEALAQGLLAVSPAALMEAWTLVFGDGRLRSLGGEGLAGGDLIEDFCRAAGIGDPAGLARPGDRNLSPGWRPVELLRGILIGRLRDGGDPAATRGFVGGRLRKAVEAAAIEHDANQRGLYLTAEHIARLVELDEADRARLDGLDADIATLSAALPPPRPFLPEAARIEPPLLSALLDGARDRLAERRPRGRD